ncbi:molybdopterin-dependent oxidoreductase, partial [Nocardioides sp. CER28]
RRALELTGVTPPPADAAYDLDVPHQPPWLTPVGDFYRIDTAIVPPAVDPAGWTLRIHGMVDHPVELTFADLVRRPVTEGWLTLNCVSNEVGGDLIGTAWWSGVRIAPLLQAAGVHPDADGVLQTSADGWTCLTPIEVLTDDRNAMLAFAQNGEPLPIDHGFPVRMLVPGLYGYVSATKWVVDLEVTRFDKAQGYWTDKGWSSRGPVKLASRIDVPRGGAHVSGGEVTVAGTAWQQHTGVRAVEISVDGGAWQQTHLAGVPGVDTWVQWRTTVPLHRGDHQVRVRATSATGEVQTSARAAPAPDGATGWHTVDFHVS